MPTLNFDDINLYYEVHGSGQPFFLHHGLSSSCQMWYEHIPWLIKKYKLVIFDARGHGLTTAVSGDDRYSWEIMADDMNRLMVHLGVDKAIIGGLSMGGGVSLTFATKYPEKVQALIISDVAGTGEQGNPMTSAKISPRQEEAREQLIRLYGTVEMGRRSIAAGLVPHQVLESEKLQHEYLERMARFSVNGAIYASRFVYSTIIPRKNKVKDINVPTLIIIGEEDFGCLPGARWARDIVENRRYVVLKNVGHSTSRYRPDAWQTAVKGFLEDLASGKDIRGEIQIS
jgi:pimeloyl-ACP methyl ester carboxylesterase